MAEGIRKISGADIGAAITGIAGPGGATRQKPVGLIYLSLSSYGGTETKELHLSGNRLRIKEAAALHLLNWLRLSLE
jgi:nicotinamide-nucleotide amidase